MFQTVAASGFPFCFARASLTQVVVLLTRSAKARDSNQRHEGVKFMWRLYFFLVSPLWAGKYLSGFVALVPASLRVPQRLQKGPCLIAPIIKPNIYLNKK